MLLLAASALVGGCITRREAVEQRSTQGPTAQQMLNLKMLAETGREPTFEEKRQWDSHLEDKISEYLRKHPRNP